MSSIEQQTSNADRHVYRYKLLLSLEDDLTITHCSRIKILQFCSTSETTASLS